MAMLWGVKAAADPQGAADHELRTAGLENRL